MADSQEISEAIAMATNIYLTGGLSSRIDERKSERAAILFIGTLKRFLEEIDGGMSVSELREVLSDIVEEPGE